MVTALLKSAAASLALLCMSASAQAQTVQRGTQPAAPLPSGPMVAVVSLREQTLKLYDATGVVRSTTVSSGVGSNPTPIGIFSVLEKRKEHWSNIYDAEMPNMQRLTWSGIAMHEGRVTGRPASHGCIRLPGPFSEDLFAITRTGMRVIIAQSQAEPAAIAHQVLFVPLRRPQEVAASIHEPAILSPDRPAAVVPASVVGGENLMLARKAARELARIAAKADEALKKLHASLIAEITRLTKTIEAAERTARPAIRAEQRARLIAEAPDASGAPRDSLDKALAAAVIKRTDTEARLGDARAALAAKRSSHAAILKQVDDADADAKTTWEAYRKLVRIGEPVSVLVSAKTGFLQVRQAFDPIFELPVAITDRGSRPLGTHVFTLMSSGTGADWSVVTLPQTGTSADTAAARALDRIAVPPEARARIEEILVPGSSLIVTDEGPSAETGKGTDFIVELNQPQPIVQDLPRSVASGDRSSSSALRPVSRPQPKTVKFGSPIVWGSDR